MPKTDTTSHNLKTNFSFLLYGTDPSAIELMETIHPSSFKEIPVNSHVILFT